MLSIVLSFTILFGKQVTISHNFASGSVILPSARYPSRNLSPQSPSESSFNPCDGMAVENETPALDSACKGECLVLKTEISQIYNAFPDYRSTQYLQNKCGMVNEGKCITGTSGPTCYCHTRSSFIDQQTMHTMSDCRSGIHIIHQFTNAVKQRASNISAKSPRLRTISHTMGGMGTLEAVHMQQGGPYEPPTGHVPKRARSNHPRRSTSIRGSCCGGDVRTDSPDDPSASHTPLLSQQEEDFNTRDDGEAEGRFLCTDVRLSGNVMRVLVDTGCNLCLIHERFAGKYVRIKHQEGTAASNQPIKIIGKVEISLEIRPGIFISMNVRVTDQVHGLLLGTDFFVLYAAKIKVTERIMELTIAQTKVTMHIKFRASPNKEKDKANMMTGQRTSYMGLKIAAILNGRYTKVVIDTGSSITIVSQDFLNNQQPLRSISGRASFMGNSAVRFSGETDVILQIENISLMVSVLVPQFTPSHSLLVGNDFNKQNLELIDYKARSVTFRIPDGPPGFNQITTAAFVTKE